MKTNPLRKVWQFLPAVLIIGTVCHAAILEGTVRDLETGQPIPQATIRVLNTGLSAAANDDGQYRLKLKPGMYDLKFSHIAHYSEKAYLSIPDGDTTIALDIDLKPSMIILNKITAYSKRYGPGQRIILEAIKRKKEILERLASYNFDAYTKLVVNELGGDSSKVFVILESQIEGYWKQPNDYKEIIVSRRQTANVAAAENMISIGEILNFNQNRLDLGRYSVVSPTAEDALDHYNYYLQDTLYLDGYPVFRLEIEPKDETNPLFAGTIDIADSTYEVVGVDVTFSKGFDTQYMKDMHYRQTYGEFNDEFWMPIGISFDGILRLGMPGLPDFSFDYRASLYDYTFKIDEPKKIFNGYKIEVAKTADDNDSLTWSNAQIVPLTRHEREEYNRIDSLENQPPSIPEIAVQTLLKAVIIAWYVPDVFHFTRVEGPYVGLPLKFGLFDDRLDLDLKTGYAFDAELWESQYQADYRLLDKPKLSVGGEYRKRVVHREFLQRALADNNATIGALISGHDPYDYYLSEGHNFRLRISPLMKTRFEFRYSNYLESSLRNVTDYSIVQNADDHRHNPPAAPGRLRSLGVGFTWDSRPLMMDKGIERKMSTPMFTLINLWAESSDPDLIDSDFHYSRFSGWLYRRQRLFNLGVTQIFISGGWSDHNLPPQKYFVQDYGEGFMTPSVRFKTLGDKNFLGNRAASIYVHHDFGRAPFIKSGIPLVKDFPFSIGIHGGAFFTRFDGRPGELFSEHYAEAPNWYSEIGFDFGQITFMDLGLFFTWRTAAYDTPKFSINMNMGLFQF